MVSRSREHTSMFRVNSPASDAQDERNVDANCQRCGRNAELDADGGENAEA
jgi:hypothetical protein